MNTNGTVYWFTGLSGAGKTTIGQIFCERLRESGRQAIFLDGDALRMLWPEEGFAPENRRRLAAWYGKLCRMIACHGADVVIATICLFHECHAWNRANIEKYKEIWLCAPDPVLQDRDTKGIYHSGVQSVAVTVEFPKNPDVTIVNDGVRSPKMIVEDIRRLLRL